MSIKKMTKDELELLSNKDITNLILEESKKPINTADLFKKIIKLLELPESTFEAKIADYYTALSTDKRFILLEDGTWDLRSRHTSDKVVKITEDEEEETEENKDDIEESIEEDEEDSYDDKDDDDYNDDTNEELKDLVVIDEDELELEQ
ncbi:MAG: DNA-directed RNA polymerase subunit delta [Tenericutes bacterium]|nr:DNA-directed RNA polymerase subunit delta [Mycoplasmatota bacterium]MDD6941775.1 DNA-directed RNA polymerase subunit delta [bacterium]MDY2696944.1 DNA-directed RNA polymerase subunit delta [Bacilli bacterium]MDY5992864.1 DNA-directed RNA polymerase subunit delta [Bacilli bacterium]